MKNTVALTQFSFPLEALGLTSGFIKSCFLSRPVYFLLFLMS